MCDFVTFEIAKKLQEKGCSVKCVALYTNVGILHCNESLGPHETCMDLLEMNNNPRSRGFIYDAPTISQVLKWLREEKKRFVVIHPTGHDVQYYYTVHNLARSFDTFEYTQSFATYEAAAIAGIEYCLDNLI